MKKLLLLTILALCVNIATAQWKQIKGFSGDAIYCFVTKGDTIFAGTSGGVYLSTNNGNSWKADTNGLNKSYTVTALAINGTNIFAGTYGNGMYLSTNNGNSWKAVNNGLPSIYNDINSLAIIGNNIFAATDGNGVFLSTNNGSSWKAVNNGLTDTLGCSLAISGTNIFAGSGEVYLSTNNGSSWNAVNNGLTGKDIWITTLAISETYIFAGTLSSGVYLSTNNGSSWKVDTNGMNGKYDVSSFAINGTDIFVGTWSSFVYISNNNGSSWKTFSYGLPKDSEVNTLTISGTNIFAGTQSGGIWKCPLSDTVSSINEILSNNVNFNIYPNPTTGKFKISINNYSTTKTNLEIYTLLGEKILSIPNFNPQSSNEIDLSNFPKGIYLLKISDTQKTSTQKIILQ